MATYTTRTGAAFDRTPFEALFYRRHSRFVRLGASWLGSTSVDCTVLTPEDVFNTSGHVDKFSDWVCKDTKKGDYLRADHLIENFLESRLAGDKGARGIAVSDEKDKVDSKKQKRAVKDIKAIKLDYAAPKKYEEILARMDNYDGDELGALIKRLDI